MVGRALMERSSRPPRSTSSASVPVDAGGGSVMLYSSGWYDTKRSLAIIILVS